MEVIPLLVMISVIIVTGQFVLLPRCYYKVGEGEALILNKMSRMLVKFDGGLAIPVFEKAHVVRITVQRIPCDCEVRSSDDDRLTLKAQALVRVNPTQEDILRAWKTYGAEMNDEEAIIATFRPKVIEALRVVAMHTPSATIHAREDYKERVITMIGTDLGGFMLEDLAIESVT